MKNAAILRAGLLPAIALALSACQSDHLVTSVNPIFQSAESNELRRQISGSTLEYTSARCVATVEYARNGARRGLTRCNGTGATPTTLTTVGTWNVRGNALCWNTQIRNGERLSREEQREEICGRPVIDGDSGVMHTDQGRLPFRIVARAG
ncbi:MAG: hypothetical protein JJT95_08335 [Pararhodobacter sp.]|nr:hypothetical protein [Pararhodobacter sp.]